MKNKRGLSQVVTTIILILLIIMAIAGIWVVIDRVILQGTSKINLEQFTIDLKIVSAKINYSSGIAEVKVRRNQGEGNLTAIKFIIEDSKTSEVFEERFTRFEELAEKTFDIDLIIQETDLIISEINKISIAPVYIIGESSSEKLGSITDSVSGIKEINVTGTGEVNDGGIGFGSGDECEINLDCGTDYFIEDTKICNELNDGILQYKKIFICSLGFCIEENVLTPVESCPSEYYCSEANCIKEDVFCTEEMVETDCGVDGFVSVNSCGGSNNILRDYAVFSCVNSLCYVEITSVVVEDCKEGEVCEGGACFVPEDCIENSDCWGGPEPNGYVCTLGNCVLEEVLESGTVRSAWPYGVSDYIDSFDLPLLQNETNMTNEMYIIFPNSNQEGCLTIKEFVTPVFEGGISYINFEESPTNVSDGDNFEVWETSYICI